MVFKDFHNIQPGEDFEAAIEQALNNCSILLVIIGDRWLNIIKERKHVASQDFVSLEISTALLKNVYVIPITINGAAMPNESELPEELKKITKKQCLNIDQTKFESDILNLKIIMDKKLGIQRN
jgi:hypothetical protein